MMEVKSTEWINEMIEFMEQVNDDLTESGELVDGRGLADPSQAKTVGIQDGVPVATDGPYAEAKESLAGYWIVDVESEARAIEIASRSSPSPKSRSRCARSWTPRRSCDDRTAASRTCCASWRRRSSARSCAGTASSTPARTPCRRRCSRPRCSGRTTAFPDSPRSWLVTVASRRLVDEWRSESARRRREETAAALELAEPDPAADQRRHAHAAVPVLPSRRCRCRRSSR